jgi:hypothetical protein
MHRSCLLRAAPLAILLAAFPGRAEAEAGNAPAPEDKPRYAAAAAEILGSNVLLNAFDRFALGADYAQIDFASISRNLSSPWTFDRDGFIVNEVGHPYQGSMYFTAGRSNGLGFWLSAAGTALGSATWELFCETEAPSINDLVSTTMGGTVLGEISHRLYKEAERGGSLFSLVASPMDALNDALFGKGSESSAVPSRFALSLEAGAAFPNLDMAEARGIAPGRSEPLGLLGESLSYGDPFESGPSEPFSRFEQRLNLGLSPSFYEVSFFSSGSLCSFPLVDDTSRKVSAGASIHYDFIFSPLIDFSANSAGLSLATAQRFQGDVSLTSEVHLFAVAMSANENVFLRERSSETGSGFRNYDFGFGEGAKVYLAVSQPRLGSLRLEYAGYGLHAIIAAREAPSSFDYSLVGMLELSYERRASGHLAVGLAYRLYHKNAFYDSFADIHESQQSLAAYAKIL